MLARCELPWMDYKSKIYKNISIMHNRRNLPLRWISMLYQFYPIPSTMVKSELIITLLKSRGIFVKSPSKYFYMGSRANEGVGTWVHSPLHVPPPPWRGRHAWGGLINYYIWRFVEKKNLGFLILEAVLFKLFIIFFFKSFCKFLFSFLLSS